MGTNQKTQHQLERQTEENTTELKKLNESLLQEIAKSKQIEIQLRKTEKRLSNVQRLAHIGNWEWDIVADELLWTDEVYYILGLEPQAYKLTYDSFLTSVHPDDRTYVEKAVEEAFSTNKPYDIDHRIVQSDGCTRIVHERAEVTFDESGKPVRMIGTIQDVTDRKWVEEEIRLQNQFLENVLESLTHPFYVIDINSYKILKANSALTQVNKVHKDTLCYSLIHRSSEPCWLGNNNNGPCPIEEVKRTKKPVRVEHIHYDQEDRPIYFEVHGYPVFDSEGNLVQMIEYSLDITNRKQAEALLRKSELEKKLVLDSMSEILIYYDINMNILWANKTALKAADVEPCRATSAHCHEIWCALDRSYSNCPVIKAKKTGEIQEAEMNTPDGRTGLVRGNPIKDEEGSVVGIVETILDITGRKKAEAEKNKIQAQFIQAQKMEAIGKLAGGVAHDFNNILTVIIGFSDLIMKEHELDETVEESIQEIRKSATRAAALTQQLLAFSRKQVLQPKVLNLNELINNIERMLQRLIGEDILLETNLSPATGLIKVDPGQMEQVIMNLAVNSRDAMPEGGKIILETHNAYLDGKFKQQHNEIKPGNYIMFTMSDTGFGMDEETKKRIFEPFYTTKEVGKGTGLGLSTIYGVIKQSEGFIYVYSELNGGTTFKIYFPVVTVTGHEKRTIHNTSLNNYGLGSENLLLVEDDPATLKVASMMLREAGYTIFEASSGRAALRMIEGNKLPPIDLLVTDVVMPVINGRELSEKILGKCPGIKVLFTSGYTEEVIMHHGVLDKGVSFLSKPFSSRDLRHKVRKVLDGSETGEDDEY